MTSGSESNGMKDEQGSGSPLSGSVYGDASDTAPPTRPAAAFPPGRPTWAEIDLNNLLHNFRLIKQTVGAAVAIMPAVKADAYGHGAVACARALQGAGAAWFGVALPEEGTTLRAAGISRPVLCLGGFWESQEDELLAGRLTPVAYRLDMLERLDAAARRAGRIADFHLKVDTGMGRLGVPQAELEAFLDRITGLQHIRLDGLMTHFASADDPDKDDFTRAQVARFESALASVRARGHQPAWIHEANSAALCAYPQARGNLVRPGGVLYGLWRDVTNPQTPPLDWRPVLSLRSRIIHLKTVPAGTPLGYGGTMVTRRESRIATIAIGYEDGLRRGLSNCGTVLVRGRRAPIAGRVSMDLTMIDVTEIGDAEIGDEAMLIGRQAESSITAEEIAACVGTISYEITCGISDRVPRLFTGH